MSPPSMPPQVIEAQLAQNPFFGQLVAFVLLGVVGVFFIYNVVTASIRYIRKLICLNDDSQRYFRSPNAIYAWIKKHILYAPLFTRRHSKQMRVGPYEAGILPSRFQALLLLGIIAMNVTFAAYGMEWHGVPRDNPMPKQTLLGHLRNRAGTLAVSNMIPLVLMSGRNSPLIKLLNVPFDTFNLLHRWFGRIVICMAITHVTCELLNMNLMGEKTKQSGYEVFINFVKTVPFIMWGFITFIALLTILVTSYTAFRHAFYETFLHVHICLVALVLAGLWIHLAAVPAQTLVKVIIAIWVVERLIRFVNILYRNISTRGNTRAAVEVLPGDALRVTINVARPWTFTPGQHLYLYLPTLGLWTSHPFSIAWSDHSERIYDAEKGLSVRDSEYLSNPQTSITLIVRRRHGVTSRLYTAALTQQTKAAAATTIITGSSNSNINVVPGTTQPFSLPALVEGPYHSRPWNKTLSSYGTLLLFAGGVGITSILPLIRHALHSYHPPTPTTTSGRTTATRKIILIWTLTHPSHLEWIRPQMQSLLSLPHRREILRIQLYITQPKSAKEVHSPSATVQMFPGRPNFRSILLVESRNQIGAMGVGVCGPGAMADDVRAAVRDMLTGYASTTSGYGGGGGHGRGGSGAAREIDLLEERFGW